MANPTLPTGKDFLVLHLAGKQKLASLPENVLPSESKACLDALGTGLSALYQVATCHLGCRGGDHIIESLVARSYNLAGAALMLIRHGYYDEALNLARSMAEIVNLLSMFGTVPNRFRDWVACSRAERPRNFRPAAVRRKIETTGLPCLVDDDAYRELCEIATHVTPSTAPNSHSADGRRFVGGMPQAAGMNKGVETLTDMVCYVAMISRKLVGQDELMAKVVSDAYAAHAKFNESSLAALDDCHRKGEVQLSSSNSRRRQ